MVATTALLIGAAIAAGSQVAGAEIQSHAANKAAGQQIAAGDKALSNLQAMWGQQQANEAPFIQQGQNSARMLGALMTPPGSPGAYQPGMAWGGGGSSAPLMPRNPIGPMAPYRSPGFSPAPTNPTLGNVMRPRMM